VTTKGREAFGKLGPGGGEKPLYIVKERPAQEIEKILGEAGIDVQGGLASGQLSVLAKEDAYIWEGHFDSNEMIALLEVR
jgi:hypothetical protein